MQTCPACQIDNPPANRFCDQCGHRLDVPEQMAPVVPVDFETIVIGRALDCDFVVESGVHDQVSRRHAEIREHPDGRLEIIDHGSANKTFVNGQALEPGIPHPLALRDNVRLGSYELNMAVVRRRLKHDSSSWPSAAPAPRVEPPSPPAALAAARRAAVPARPHLNAPPLPAPPSTSVPLARTAPEAPPTARRGVLTGHQRAMLIAALALVAAILAAVLIP